MTTGIHAAPNRLDFPCDCSTDDVPEHVDRVLSKPPKMAELRAVLAELVGEGKRG